jgi:hypothetical protein
MIPIPYPMSQFIGHVGSQDIGTSPDLRFIQQRRPHTQPLPRAKTPPLECTTGEQIMPKQFLLLLAAAATLLAASSAQALKYYRIQLKSSGQYLDATYCASPVSLNPGSSYANGACQAWAFIPAGDGWYKIQLKSSGQYLDAAYCSSPIGLNPGSSYAGGACQLWRLVPAGNGWSRLQLKINNQYLDADHCTTTLALNPGSSYADGDCQLWKLVPMSVRID